ncbi:hypothetical protein [Acidovorax phage AP1]|nr:hypothetical protein [Acidovorax phage AP1]
MHGHHSLAAKTLSALPRPGFRGGGLIRGPGTGTSDSIPAEVPPGTYILPKDTTEATGLAARALGDVPVAVSNGEFEVTPEQVQSIGAAVLDILRGVTHMPVEVEDEQAEGGQEEPGEAREGYANGGQVMPGYRMDAAADPRSTVYGSNDPYAASNAARMSGLANSIGSRGVMELGRAPAPQPPTARNSFGDAAAATVDPMVTQLPQFRRPGYADGGLVTDEERRQGLVSQIPTGGMSAPPADGSQNNPLNTEVGRNALNTLSALPGTTGLAARAGGGAARGASTALSADRVIPAAWEVVQDGGALAARTASAANPATGALTRAASLAPDVVATGAPGRAAQMLGGPSGQLAQRTATGVGDAMPSAGAAARGATPYADIVEPLALGGPGAGQGAAMAAQGAGNAGRLAAAGGAGGLAAAAMLAGDSSAGGQVQGAPNNPTAPTTISSPTRSLAAEALMGPSMSASNSITRDGNSYSGPANLSGDVSIRNPDGSLRAPAALSTVPGGGISAQNMAAADALASRENAASLGRLGLAGGAPGFSGVIGQQGNGNMWTRTPDQQRRDAEVQASSIDRGTAAQGAAALKAMDAQALQGVKSQGDVDVAQIQGQGLLNRTLITERGNNTRAAIAAQGQAAAAALKAQQGNKPPEGYRWTASGGLEAIPGGPAAAKVADQQQTKDAGFDATRQTIGTINRLLANNNGLTGATGMVGIQRFFPGTDAADFAAQVETLKAQTFLPMVQQLRGMGALSNAEGDKLNAAVGALNFNMSEKAFAESLGRIRDQLSGALQKAGIDTKGASTWGLQPPSTVAEQGQGGQPAATPAAQRSVTRTGMVNGRRVAQYSDGSIEYAD